MAFLLVAARAAAAPVAAQGPAVVPPAEACFQKGVAAYGEQRYEEAITHLEACLRHPVAWKEYPYYFLLLSHWDAGDAAEALGLCEAFRKHFPDSPLRDRVAHVEAQAYQAKGAYWLAARAYEEFLRSHDRSDARLRYGEVLEALDRLSAAFEDYQGIRRKWPWSADARVARVRARKIAEEHPRWRRNRSEVGLLWEEVDLCLRERAYDEALAYARRLLALDLPSRTYLRARSAQIRAYVGKGELESAYGILLQLIEQHPGSEEVTSGLLQVGRAYWRKDRNQEAYPILTYLVEEHTDSVEARRGAFILGRIHFETGNLDAAIRQYRETRFLFPDTPWEDEAAWGEAWCYYLQGEFERCAEHLHARLAEGTWDAGIPRALYWEGRCLEKAGRVEEARVVYERLLAEHPESYYSVVARWRVSDQALWDLLKTPTGARLETDEPRTEVLDRLADPALPVLLRAGLQEEAVRRLAWLKGQPAGEQLSPSEWVEACAAVGDYLGALRYAGREGLLDEVVPGDGVAQEPEARRLARFLYPFPFQAIIQEQAAKNGLDPLLVAGLIRQESVFAADAVSPAGALGLMQVMPATGRRVAREIGMEGFRTAWLRDPEPNVRIGTAYLSKLVDTFGRDWSKVFAAYNAGPNAVEHWSALMPSADVDEFVEGIRYRETRLYVKKVLANWSMYRALYLSTVAEAPAVPPPAHEGERGVDG